jgi:hypothetical protein
VQANILDRCPDNRYAAGLRGEHINLIGALSHIAKQPFDGIGGLNVPMHRQGEVIKGVSISDPAFCTLRFLK